MLEKGNKSYSELMNPYNGKMFDIEATCMLDEMLNDDDIDEEQLEMIMCSYAKGLRSINNL